MLGFGKFMEAAEDCERDGLSDTIPEEGHSRPSWLQILLLTFSVNVLKGRISGWVFTFSSREIPYFHPLWLCRNVLSSNQEPAR